MTLPHNSKDKDLWTRREELSGLVIERIFVTEDGAIGICYSGECFIKTVKNWVKLALAKERNN